MSELEKLKEEIKAIKLRNQKVEASKTWETSLTRRTSVAVLTYVLVTLFFYITKVERPLQNALMPTLGFLLSTMTLDILKSKWLQSRK